MALGSRGQKNFGLSTNLTLPMVHIDPNPNTAAYMPGEQNDKRKKHARFALDQEASEDKTKKKSWFGRLFKKSKKGDQVAPDTAPQATPRAGLGDDDDDDEELVKLMRTESNPELSTTSPEGAKDKKKKKKKKKKGKDRKTKAQSTAFEHLSSASQGITPSTLHILLKPQSPSNGSRKIVLRHKEGSTGYGIHLSGGLPPVTITYVEPRSEADLQGAKVGDVVLDINGLNCRKKVDMAQLLQLKMLVQQAPAARTAAGKQEQIDEAAWGKIKSKQDEIDADRSKIQQQPISVTTSVKGGKESSSPPQPATTAATATTEEIKPKEKKTSKTKLPSSSGGIGEPLATSSPLRDEDTQPRKKKKDSTASQDDNQTVTSKKKFSTLEDGKRQKRQSGVVNGTMEDKKKKRQSASLSVDESGHDKKKRQSASLSMDENGNDKKKRQSASISVDENTHGKSRSQSTSLSVDETEQKKSKRQSASLSVDDNGHKKKKRQSASLSASQNGQPASLSVDEPPTSLSVDGNGQTGTEKRKKRSSKSHGEASDVSKPSPSHVKVVEVEINASTAEQPQNRKSSREQHAKKAKADGSVEVIDRSDRTRRSSSPKARYRTGEEEDPKIIKIGESAGQGKAAKAPGAGKVTVGEIKKKSKNDGKKKKKSKEDDKENSEAGDKKKSKDDKKKSKDDKKKSKDDKKDDSKSGKKEKAKDEKKSKKKKKSTGDPPSAAAAASAVSSAIAEAAIPKGSAAVSGTIESNTMTYTSRHASKTSLNASKSSLNSKNSMLEDGEGKNATLPRKKALDKSSSMGSVVSHSISSSDLREETENFRKELREASQSQQDINIDPNIKVKKGGVIKEGRSVERRPSLPSFDQSSSPEPVEASPISSGAVEDNILDPEFKMKKSGVVMGKKTSSSSRPSILDESKETTPPKDIVPGEIKYNRQVEEDVEGDVELDISAVPEISPSLGLVAGRDRLDTVNRSLTRRRPPSQWKPGEEAGAAASPSTSRTMAARKLFESKQQENTVERRFSKSVDKPVKTLGAVPDKKPTSPTTTTPGKEAGKSTAPNWVAMAQIRQKRLSQAEEKASKPAPEATPAPAADVPKATEPASTNTSSSQDSSVPQMGTVAARLAMFQRR